MFIGHGSDADGTRGGVGCNSSGDGDGSRGEEACEGGRKPGLAEREKDLSRRRHSSTFAIVLDE